MASRFSGPAAALRPLGAPGHLGDTLLPVALDMEELRVLDDRCPATGEGYDVVHLRMLRADDLELAISANARTASAEELGLEFRRKWSRPAWLIE